MLQTTCLGVIHLKEATNTARNLCDNIRLCCAGMNVAFHDYGTAEKFLLKSQILRIMGLHNTTRNCVGKGRVVG
jgi:hypothetical protein